jgi:hypothetical protein
MEEHKPREGGQLLVFETKRRKGMGFSVNLGSAKLHTKRFSCWVDYCFGEHILPQQETAFYISGEKKRLYWRFWISPAVNSRNRGKSLSRPCIHGAKRTYTSVFMQLQGKLCSVS